MSERVHMRLEVMRNDSIAKLNELFRLKVQLEEQVKDNDMQIHYFRGSLDTLVAVQKISADLDNAASKIDNIGGDGGKPIDFPELTTEEIAKLAKTKPLTTM